MVIVARPQKFGNPYRIGDCVARSCSRPTPHWHVYDLDRTPIHGLYPATRADAAEFAVKLFRAALDAADDPRFPFTSTEVRTELAARDLGCWCPLDQPCHADVLLDVANSP